MSSLSTNFFLRRTVCQISITIFGLLEKMNFRTIFCPDLNDLVLNGSKIIDHLDGDGGDGGDVGDGGDGGNGGDGGSS